jgi:hypothetical protein
MTPKVAEDKAKKYRTAGDIAFICAFAIILGGGTLARIAGFSGVHLEERRTLSAAPHLPSTWREINDFPAAVDRYVNDNFGLRDELIRLNSYLHYRLGVSSQRRVLVGNRGWLFFRGDDDFAFFRGANRLSEAQIKEWVDRMDTRQKWLAERGIQFVILPAPLKETIYPEFLPFWLRQQGSETAVDQILSAVRGKANINLIDVRERLRQRKKSGAVYEPYDTHWNAEGAFIGYSAVMEKIGLTAPSAVPLAWNSLKLQRAPPERVQRNLSLMLGIDRFVSTEWFEHIPATSGSIHTDYLTAKTGPESPQMITTGAANKSRILLVRDSYVWAMLPYFEDTFGSILIRHVQDGSFPTDYIEQYRPAVVVLEVQEGGLSVM